MRKFAIFIKKKNGTRVFISLDRLYQMICSFSQKNHTV